MTTMTLYDAVGAALTEEMRRDPTVLVFGEGIATKRHDLVQEFGARRVRSGSKNSTSAPAHITCSSGTGGRSALPVGEPSAASRSEGVRSGKYSQCHSGGRVPDGSACAGRLAVMGESSESA